MVVHGDSLEQLTVSDLLPSERRAVASGALYVYRVFEGQVHRYSVQGQARAACRRQYPHFVALADTRAQIESAEQRRA